MRDYDQRVLGDRQQAFGLGRHGDALVAVDMDDEPRLFPRGVNRRVDGEARRIDAVGTVHDDVAVQVDLDHGGGCHLFEEHAERVDEEVMLGSGHARGDVGEDQIVPLLHRDQAVERGQIDPCLPFRFADLPLQRADTREIAVGHGVFP